MVTGEAANGTDWPLVIATAGGAVAVILAAFFAGVFSAWQSYSQYREGLNTRRREVYPELLKWTEKAEIAVNKMHEGPGAFQEAELWCCASSDLIKALQELNEAWGASFSRIPAKDHSSDESYKTTLLI